MTAAARPVLKWAGGKSRLLDQITSRLPDAITTYYEPFLGGAAVFFRLAAQSRFEHAVLSDRNPQLVEVYRGLKRNVAGVIKVLKGYRHDRDEYYRIRALDAGTLDASERVARFIYLNKTGYNGLYRVNRSGQFNVPFGRYEKVNFCDEENLRAAARALRKAEIVEADFEETASRAKPGDAVYFDPPYVPLSRTSNFTAYHHEPFDDEEQARLAAVFRRLSMRGVHALLSNSDTARTRELYAGWTLQTIPVTRPINSKKDARGTVDELLVINRRNAKR